MTDQQEILVAIAIFVIYIIWNTAAEIREIERDL